MIIGAQIFSNRASTSGKWRDREREKKRIESKNEIEMNKTSYEYAEAEEKMVKLSNSGYTCFEFETNITWKKVASW